MSLAALLLVAVALVAPVLSVSPPSVSGSSCHESSSVINDLKGVPRLDFGGNIINSDWGAYQWVTCSGSDNSSCTLYDPINDIKNFASISGSKESPVIVIESYVSLVGFGILMAIVSLVIGLLLCWCRYCCCCIKGGTCGKRWPTVKTRCCGIQLDPVTGVMGYSATERWVSRIYMWIFVVFMVVWSLLSYFNGTMKIPDAMKSIADSPQPLIDTMQSLAHPVKDLIINIGEHTAPLLVAGLVSAINNATNLTNVVTGMDCILYNIDHNIPNITLLQQFVTELQNDTGAVQVLLDTRAPAVLSALQWNIGNVSADVSSIGASSYSLTLALGSGISSIASIGTSLAPLTAFTNAITDAATGIPSITSDLSTLSQLPNSTAVSTVSTDVATLTAAFLTFSEAAHLVNTLDDISASYNASPNYTSTGDHLSSLSDSIGSLDTNRVFDTIITSVNATGNAITNISAAIVHTNTTLTALVAAINSVNLSSPLSLMMDLNTTIHSLSNFTIIVGQMDLVYPLMSVIPCMFTVINATEALNASLLQLPSSFTSIIQLAPSLNSSLYSAVSEVAVIENQISTFEQQINNVSISDYVSQINTMGAMIASNVNAVLTPINILSAAYQQTQALSLTNQTQSLVALNATIHNVTINSSISSMMTALETMKLNALSLMTNIVPDLSQYYTTGYCSVSGSVCASNTDCISGAGTCQGLPSSTPSSPAPIKRCRVNGAQPCNHDSDCTGASDRCLVDSDRLMWLATNISAIHAVTPSSSDLSSLIDQLTTINSQAQPSNSGLDSINATRTDAQSLLGSVDLSSVNTTLASVTTSLATVPLSDITAQIAAASQSLASVDLSSARSTLNDLASSINSVYADRGQINEASQLIHKVNQLITTQIYIYLDQISAASLSAAYDRGGLTTMAEQVLGTLDQATAFLNDSNYLAPTNISNDLTSDIKHYLDVLSTPTYSQYGPIYFVASLVYKDKLLDLDTYSVSNFHTYDKDINGNKYPDDRYCLTRDCISSSIDYYATSSLSTSSDGSVPIGVSAVNALSIPLILPIIIALIGLLASAMVNSHKWASCCASTSACIMFISMPIIFVLVGLIWPFAVVMFADACRGGVSIGNQYIASRTNYVCDQFSGTMISSNQCQITKYNVTIDIDIAAAYASVAGNGCSADSDPFANVWSSLSNTVSSYPVDKVNDAIDSLNDSSGDFRLRDPLITVARNAAIDAGRWFTVSIDDASQLLGCENLSQTFNDVKAAFCCDTATTVYWSISAWYLIAFTMLLCGWPAAMLGRKRFARTVWGDVHVMPISGDNLAHASVQYVPSTQHYAQAPPVYGQPVSPVSGQPPAYQDITGHQFQPSPVHYEDPVKSAQSSRSTSRAHSRRPSNIQTAPGAETHYVHTMDQPRVEEEPQRAQYLYPSLSQPYAPQPDDSPESPYYAQMYPTLHDSSRTLDAVPSPAPIDRNVSASKQQPLMTGYSPEPDASPSPLPPADSESDLE